MSGLKNQEKIQLIHQAGDLGTKKVKNQHFFSVHTTCIKQQNTHYLGTYFAIFSPYFFAHSDSEEKYRCVYV